MCQQPDFTTRYTLRPWQIEEAKMPLGVEGRWESGGALGKDSRQERSSRVGLPGLRVQSPHLCQKPGKGCLLRRGKRS